jgi:hypothetical protein
MIDPLDIFALDGEGKYVWIDTAHSFLDASKAMCKHAGDSDEVDRCFRSDVDHSFRGKPIRFRSEATLAFVILGK